MFVSRLALDHYRSWHHVVVDFRPGINVLFGANGLGKTNIVEALDVLSTGGSHRTSGTVPLVMAGQRQAVIRANVRADADDAEAFVTYEVSIPVRGANRARIDSGKSLYMRDVVGKVPTVTFSPDDQRLVSGEPSLRRRFINQAASQLLPGYYDLHQRFTQIARQRAALLKSIGRRRAEGEDVDASLSGLEIWTGQFIDVGIDLTEWRSRLVDGLAGPFARIYGELAGGDQTAELVYAPSFDELGRCGGNRKDARPMISEHFRRIYAGEVSRAQNLIGPHRDDVTVRLNGMAAREYASNGELWTLALALRMALFEVLSDGSGICPILVLDDVFAQLDDDRRRQILEFARRQDQVLITMASRGDMPRMDDDGSINLIDVAELSAIDKAEGNQW